MAQKGEIKSQELLLRRVGFLTESLNSMRTSDKGDIVLVCNEKQFFAHKLVLEASSDYFVTMFRSGLEESKRDRIVFTEMDCETLDIILDFLYLGKVDKIKTNQVTVNVLKAAHLMQLPDLFAYCCNNLISTLSVENFVELFDVGQKYDIQNWKSKLLTFWFVHEQELLSTEQFLLWSFNQLKDFILFLVSHNVLLDNVLLWFTKWVKHEPDDRGKVSTGLLDDVDCKLLTKRCVQTLLNSQDLLLMPDNYRKKIKKIGLTMFMCDDHVSVSFLNTDFLHRPTRLVFFSAKCNEEVFSPSQNTNVVARTTNKHCSQQLDLATMSWLPLCDAESAFASDNSVCEHQQFWFVVEEGRVVMYDAEKRGYLDCGAIDKRIRYSICYFQDNLYVTGGAKATRYNNVPQSDVFYSKPQTKIWGKATSLQFPSDSTTRSTVLTSKYYMYVLDHIGSEIRIQYNSAPHTSGWQVVYVSTEDLLKVNNFFIFEQTLHALYLSEGKTMHLIYSHDDESMRASTFLERPEGATEITRICTCVVNRSTVLYISSHDDTFRIPNFTWDPITGKWSNLLLPSGKLEIPSAINSLVT